MVGFASEVNMPRFGPHPKQFSQAGANAGDIITAGQPTPTTKAAPAYQSHSFYLGAGIFGNASNASLVKGDTNYPDFDGDFDSLDQLESFADSQRLDVSYQGRLSSFQSAISEVRIFIKGDDAGASNPPQYRLAIYVEGAASANPVYDSGQLDAPSVLTEFVVSSLSEQPLGSKRYHVVVEAYMDTDQNIQCSRPFVRQE